MKSDSIDLNSVATPIASVAKTELMIGVILALISLGIYIGFLRYRK